ncbi:hypothetical protein PISMIDRAFT_124884 [Pisolithus microcarpus 441]|uniref:Mitochondrial outer membrane transport complex Sam37/metaxin N-terminal domain-containing protein n=1 Tax=Pisolithus microcarpus 441 TaxID=765257 RepID=A0A0C9Z0A9_9AGAM|nr:hypothetical protein PISMIDRAFT_124884 [Pisolithus microcarpus 441]
MPDASYVLHVWSSQWGLQSLDPICLASIMYLQLSMPGKFQVAESCDPDMSPNGHLPFLTHGHLAHASFPSIVSFVTSLSRARASGVRNIDASLSASQRAQSIAWWSHVEANLGDLVSHMFFGVDANFWGLTRPTLTSVMPIPQRYYVPGRIRESYRRRLETSGLWCLPATEQEHKSPFAKNEKKRDDHTGTFTRAFEREKVMEKARTILDLYARLLDGKKFLFNSHPTSLDVCLAAHILLLANPPFPSSVLQILLLEKYASLVDHARRVQHEVAQSPPYELAPPSKSSVLSLFTFGRAVTKEAKTSNPDDVRFRRMRWAWVTLALGAAAFNVMQFSKALLILNVEDEEGDEDEDAYDEGADLEEDKDED